MVSSWLKPAVADGVIQPEELDRSVLRAEFLELGLLHLGIRGRCRCGLPLHAARPGPFAFGEIQRQLDSVLVARLAHLGQHVPPRGLRVTLRSVVLVSQRQKPSWCLVRKRM